jgi:hypothetical protein
VGAGDTLVGADNVPGPGVHQGPFILQTRPQLKWERKQKNSIAVWLTAIEKNLEAVFPEKVLDRRIAMRLIGEVDVDVYEIVPSPASRWVVVSQINGDEMTYRWFVREDETFLEREHWDLPVATRRDGHIVHAMQRFATSSRLGLVSLWRAG